MNVQTTTYFVVLMVLLGFGGISCDLANEQSGEETPNPPDDREIRFTHNLITNDLEYPWQMAFTDDRILITEVKGLVRLVEDGELQPEPWFDLRPYMESQGLRFPEATDGGRQRSGLQGIAVDPNFEENGFVYIGFAYHTDDHSYDYNRLLRLREDPETEEVAIVDMLLDKVPGYDLHQAAQLKFGPDDKLYWSTGDRFDDPVAQDLNDLSGKILRLNRDGSIPADNPFPNSYVYSYGHRNPQGFDWHPEKDLMLATEHGPSGGQGCCRDELNIVEAGKNYGWPNITAYQSAPGMETPLLHSGNEPDDPQFVRDSTWAPSGAAFVHSGPWKGSFLFAGLRSRMLYQVKLTDDNQVDEIIPLIDTNESEYFRARSVDQAPDGDIYMITSNMDRTYRQDLGRTDLLIRIKVFYVD